MKYSQEDGEYDERLAGLEEFQETRQSAAHTPGESPEAEGVLDPDERQLVPDEGRNQEATRQLVPMILP